MALKLRKKQNKKQQVVKKVIVQSAAAKSGVASSANEVQFNIPQTAYSQGVGRRKVATARVRIYEGEGDFVVNNKVVGEYFSGIKNAPALYNKPFELTGTKGKFAVTAHINGSGIEAQLDALVHGIARALSNYKPEFRIFLKGAGLLTRDDRMKETRKIGMGGKARRQRQSPKR